MNRPDMAREWLGRARTAMRARQFSPRTEESYVRWIRQFLRFAERTSPDMLCGDVGRRFLEELATERRLSGATRNQAASAVAFLLREVVDCPGDPALPRARGKARVPEVFTPEECRRVLAELSGRDRLAAALMYGSGLRLAEVLGLRVKDVSFDPQRLVVRAAKGGKERQTLMADHTANALRRQIERVARVHQADLEQGHGWARVPGALDRKSPNTGYELGWQFMFPSRTVSVDPATGRTGRFHVHPTVIQRAVKEAIRRAGVTRHASCHTFRHSFATHALRMGIDVRFVQELMGHKDLKTTQLYLHVLDRAGYGIKSPLDRLMED